MEEMKHHKQLYISFIQHGLINKSFQSYENIRRPETNDFVLSARDYGPDKIVRIIDERSPYLFDIISSNEIENIIFNSKQMSGWNVQIIK